MPTSKLAKHYVLECVRQELEKAFERFEHRFKHNAKDQRDFLEEVHLALDGCLDGMDAERNPTRD